MKSINIDCIICTYNRPKRVSILVEGLKMCSPSANKIIVVDSSDTVHHELKADMSVIYLPSSHKNQPYQRYLGYKCASSDYLLYLDDDMEILSYNIFHLLQGYFESSNAVGIALNFRDKYRETSLSRLPKSSLKFRGRLKAFKNYVSAYGEMPDGKLGLNGLRGSQPSTYGLTELISGGAFAVKRESIFEDFNFQVFDLFEKRIGMGEDVIIGYTLSKQGEIYFLPEILFLHNDLQDSSYSMDIYRFSERVVYSRLYLTLEKVRLDDTCMLKGRFIYHWHTLWRISGILINFCTKPSRIRFLVLQGALVGWIKSFGFVFKGNSDLRSTYWSSECIKDLGLSNHKAG